MPENTYTKKKIMKDGSVKIYEYKYDSSEYTKKFWIKRSQQEKVNCPICNKLVYSFYMERHQNKPICQRYAKLLTENSDEVLEK